MEKKIINLDRQFLHAVSLGFTHPTKNKRMNFKSKLPNDLENILKKESAKLSPGSLIKVIGKSHGDIRSMINLTQSLVTGFNPQTETSFESINVEDGVNAFFKANSIERGFLIFVIILCILV